MKVKEFLLKTKSILRFCNATIFFLVYTIVTWLLFTLNDIYTPKKYYERIRMRIKFFYAYVVMGTFYILVPRNFYLSIDKTILEHFGILSEKDGKITYIPYKDNKLKKMVLMSNHLSEFDFVFYIRALYEYDLIGNMVFGMKYELFSVPFFGDICKYCEFIGINRKDPNKLQKYISDISQMNLKNFFTYIFFPEGTIYAGNTYEKNLEWCKNNKVKPFDFVIYPRSGGIQNAIELVRSNNLKNTLDTSIETQDVEFNSSDIKMRKYDTLFLDGTIFFNPFSNNFSPMGNKIKMMALKSHECTLNIILENATDFTFLDDKNQKSNSYVMSSFAKKDSFMKKVKQNKEFINLESFKEFVNKEHSVKKHIQKEHSFYTHQGFVMIIFLYFILFYWCCF